VQLTTSTDIPNATLAAIRCNIALTPMSERAQILIRHAVDLKVFRDEIMPAAEPVVLKGLVSNWPAVRAGRESARALGDYLRGFDLGKPVAVLEGPPSIRGQFFYRDDMRGLNFERRAATIGATIDRLLAQFDDPNPPALYIESTPTADHLPPFAAANSHPLLPPTIAPRIWIGNTLIVQPHFDLSSNIACVVGRSSSMSRDSRSAWSRSTRRTSRAFRASPKRFVTHGVRNSSPAMPSTFLTDGGTRSNR
jgi:hypothetical protein